MNFLGLLFPGLKVLRSHLWMSPDNTIWSARKERRICSLKEHLFTRYLYNLAHFWNPLMGAKYIRDITGHVSDRRQETDAELR